jgi:hypothetical protein
MATAGFEDVGKWAGFITVTGIGGTGGRGTVELGVVGGG